MRDHNRSQAGGGAPIEGEDPSIPGDPGVPSQPTLYGGQAVLEGVMMRGQTSWAVAVRRPSSEIYVKATPLRTLAERHKLFRLPFFRGVAVLLDSMAIGVRALAISGHQSLGEDEQLSQKQMNWSLGIGAVFFSVVFILIPALGTNWLSKHIPDNLTFNLIEGLARLGMFLLYIVGISMFKDIRRVFEYHGAEHMAIHCYEARLPLNIGNVARFPTLHVRCGTNFLLILFATMLLLFTVAFGIFGRPPLLIRVASHLLAVPVIVGIAYEGIRLGAGKEHSAFVQALMRPGLWLQMLTTKPPAEDQIEVAIRALEHVLPQDERGKVDELPSPVVLDDEQEPSPAERAGERSDVGSREAGEAAERAVGRSGAGSREAGEAAERAGERSDAAHVRPAKPRASGHG